MRSLRIRRIDPLSLAKILGALYVFLGFLGGCFVSLISLFAGGVGLAGGDEGALAGIIFGVGAVLFIPIFYGAMGFIGGFLVGVLYNVVSRWVGGIEFEVEETAEG